MGFILSWIQGFASYKLGHIPVLTLPSGSSVRSLPEFLDLSPQASSARTLTLTPPVQIQHSRVTGGGNQYVDLKGRVKMSAAVKRGIAVRGIALRLIDSGGGKRGNNITMWTCSCTFSSRTLGFTLRIAWSKGVQHQRLTSGHKGIARLWGDIKLGEGLSAVISRQSEIYLLNSCPKQLLGKSPRCLGYVLWELQWITNPNTSVVVNCGIFIKRWKSM